MTSWFSQTVSIDEQVEKATSESLPTGEQDMALNLDICDMIRSKTVNSKDAMRSLKRRMMNKNPNVQIATLHLIDICIKNGGSHFLNEIASREFMDSLMLTLKPASGGVNSDVKQLMLEYIQNWAIAFDNQIQLSYVNKIYNQLKQEGYEFPSSLKLSSSFIDSSAPPEWVDSDTCMKSGVPFSFVNRKHHCRNCGGVFIQKHCQSYIPLPHFGINTEVRVCDDCYDKVKGKRKNSTKKDDSTTIKYSNNPFLQNTAKPVDENDDDLQKALKLSLEESNKKASAAKPSFTSPATPAPPPDADTGNEDEEDEEMKAAIAASLRDMEPANDNTNGLYQQQQQAQPPQSQSHAQQLPPPPQQQQQQQQVQQDEFTQLEEEILYRYVHLVESIQRAPQGSILKETKLQQLNDSVSALRPKLARTLGQSIDKYDRLVDMHGKLTTVVRFYDQILEQRLSNTYNRHSISDHGYHNQESRVPLPQQQQNYYQYQNQSPIAPMGTGNSYYQQQTPTSPPSGQHYPPPINTATHPQEQPSAPPLSDFERRYPPISEENTPSAPPQPSSSTQQDPKTKHDEPVLIEL